MESTNQKIKVTIAAGYGFRNTDNLIAIVMLRCSDEQPALPWEVERRGRGTKGRGGTVIVTGRGAGLRHPRHRQLPKGIPSHEYYRRLCIWYANRPQSV